MPAEGSRKPQLLGHKVTEPHYLRKEAVPRAIFQNQSGYFSFGSSLKLSQAPEKGIGSHVLGEDLESVIHVFDYVFNLIECACDFLGFPDR